jgi:hypothetical protein
MDGPTSGREEITNTPNERIFGSVANQLVANGWSVFPQEMNGRPGKVYGHNIQWQHLSDTAPTPESLKDWTNFCGTLNAACVMGAGSGNAVCVNIDVSDESMSMDIADMAEEVLGATPLKRVGKEPQISLIYRQSSEAPLPSSLIGREGMAVEIHGAGKAVPFCGREPSTGNYYRWLDKSPLEVGPQAAPVVSEQQMADFLALVSDRYKLEKDVIAQAAQQPDSGSGGRAPAPAPAWNTRFKVASAAKRQPIPTVVPSVVPRAVPNRRLGAEVIRAAKLASPEAFLRQHFRNVYQNQRQTEISVDDTLRVTKTENGVWVSCDWHEGGIGDNIALVRHVLPNTSFYDAIFLLTGSQTDKPTTVAEPPPPPKPERERRPKIPYQGSNKQGRVYLQGRGISLASIEHAEKSGALRHISNGVLFCGFENSKDVRSATVRYFEPLSRPDGSQMSKRDFQDSNKAYPCVLPGGKRVVIVEGGVNALAIRDMALRRGKEPPTVVVTGGVGVRAWLNTPHMRALLEEVEDVTIMGENEKEPEIQDRTDSQRNKLAEEIAHIRQGEVPKIVKPPGGCKDAADWNVAQQKPPEPVPAPKPPQPKPPEVPTPPPAYVYRPR